MSVQYFEGAAGTGKTTRLINAVLDELAKNPLGEGQKILVLTFMHGSRRRLEETLSRMSQLRGKYYCQTIDSFAWRIINRWNSFAVYKGIEVSKHESKYDETCDCCAKLLHFSQISLWVAFSYPIVMVDELQDCKKERLDVIDGLTQSCKIFAAADWFQDLSGADECLAVEWLKEKGTGEELSIIHRTKQEYLICTSNEIRKGIVPSHPSGKGIFIGHGRNLAHSVRLAAQNLQWHGSRDAAILCPTGPDKCKLFREVIKELKTKQINATVQERVQKFGPFKIAHEQSSDDIEKELLKAIGLDSSTPTTIISTCKIIIDAKCLGMTELSEWLKNEARYKDRTKFTVEEISDQIRRIVQRVRAFTPSSSSGIKAMTIHQAKNREFSNVILLWPHRITGAKESQKRLLYNGITRAKEHCTVIIQGQPEERRIQSIFDDVTI